MFIDHTKIQCEAGSGGNGCHSFEKLKHLKHPRPNGGDGGHGGSIVLLASKDVHTLLDLQMRKTFYAASGKHGGSNHMHGANGEDLVVHVPIGTQVFDDENGLMLADLMSDGMSVKAVRGGQGGKGNHRKADATKGFPGEDKQLRLELKLIADIGLVGFPNAGKSTFISHISNAKSRIAAYPFTTKEPVLGVLKSDYGDSLVVADIPGLIQGAHEGRGLGHRFLRHIERTRFLLHVIDMASFDGRDPVDDYKVIKQELAEYSAAFAQKPSVIVANKMDIPEAEANLVKFRKAIKENIFPISAATGQGLGELTQYLFKSVVRDNE